MKLLIIKENFDINRIFFRESKSSIKISYNINFISMVGITFNLVFKNCLDKGHFLILNIDEKEINFFNKIDKYFIGEIDNYDKILNNDSIRIKKHKNFKIPKDNVISITLNSIKNIFGRNKVQIFSI